MAADQPAGDLVAEEGFDLVHRRAAGGEEGVGEGADLFRLGGRVAIGEQGKLPQVFVKVRLARCQEAIVGTLGGLGVGEGVTDAVVPVGAALIGGQFLVPGL